MIFSRSVRSLLLVATAVLALASCGEFQDWRSTERADTIESYEAFLEQYPDSQYDALAKRRLADLIEQRDWLLATERDTAEAYRSFINAHPKGRWLREARVRLQNFMAAPGVLGPAAVEPFEPIEAPPPPAMLPSEPSPTEMSLKVASAASTLSDPIDAEIPVEHRIQLGAFSTREKAMEGWRSIRERHPELQGLVSQIVPGPLGNGSIYRLQASVVSEARAREICRVLVKAGQACVYVPPGR